MLGTIELPPVIRKPKKSRRGKSWVFSEPPPQRCPYCLETLQALEGGPSLQRGCPICQHSIPITILGTAPHCFNRAQKWDLLANEMEHIWHWEYVDVQSYLPSMGGYYNPDYSDAKDRLVDQMGDKEAVVRLREEFMEAEGELDLLIISYLQKRRSSWRGLGERLAEGRKWRVQVVELSLLGAGRKEVAEFQLAYVRSMHWAVFGSLERHETAVLFLEEMVIKAMGNE